MKPAPRLCPAGHAGDLAGGARRQYSPARLGASRTCWRVDPPRTHAFLQSQVRIPVT